MSFRTLFATALKAFSMTRFLCQAAKAELAARGAGQVFVDCWICCKCLNDLKRFLAWAMNGNDSKRWCRALRVLKLFALCALFFGVHGHFIYWFHISHFHHCLDRDLEVVSCNQVNFVHKTQTKLCRTSEELGFVELKLTTARGLRGSKLGGHRSEIRPPWVYLCVGLGCYVAFEWQGILLCYWIWWQLKSSLLWCHGAMPRSMPPRPTARSHSIPSQDPLPSWLGNEGELVNDVVADKAHARVVVNNVKTLGVLKYKSSMSLCNETNVTKMKDDEFGTLNPLGSRAWMVMIVPWFHPSNHYSFPMFSMVFFLTRLSNQVKGCHLLNEKPVTFFVYIPQHSGKAPPHVMYLALSCCEPYLQSVWQLALLCYPCPAIACCICGVQAKTFLRVSVGCCNRVLSPGATASLNVAIAGSIVTSSQVSLAHCHAWEQDIAVAFVTAIIVCTTVLNWLMFHVKGQPSTWTFLQHWAEWLQNFEVLHHFAPGLACQSTPGNRSVQGCCTWHVAQWKRGNGPGCLLWVWAHVAPTQVISNLRTRTRYPHIPRISHEKQLFRKLWLGPMMTKRYRVFMGLSGMVLD